MSDSSALYLKPDLTLEEAQEARHARIMALLEPEPYHEVLEIGCGWGGLATRLGETGCTVTALTLSPAQLAYARDMVAAANLAARVDLRLQDYRLSSGSFDRVVSIEMLEAVGEAFWPRYFEILHERLKPGGLAGTAGHYHRR